ncbi:MAG: nucleotidyltransferase family protein, partial [Bacteroidota bacterium]
LLHAERYFRKDAPFFLHNSDVMTDIDLAALYDAHMASSPLATLAVRPLETARYLIFDDDGLCGYSSVEKHATEGNDHFVRDPAGTERRLDFAGVHVLSPRIFDLVTEEGVFSIINTYLRLAAAGERILPFETVGLWIDIGNHERLEVARSHYGSEASR